MLAIAASNTLANTRVPSIVGLLSSMLQTVNRSYNSGLQIFSTAHHRLDWMESRGHPLRIGCCGDYVMVIATDISRYRQRAFASRI
jgi:hypothetical protein